MANEKLHLKMSVKERAKQFMPFAALKGLPEAFAAKEKIYVEKRELSEETAKELDLKIRNITCGEIVIAEYYCDGEYLKIMGMVAKIDFQLKFVQIVDTKIDFTDILDISFPD